MHICTYKRRQKPAGIDIERNYSTASLPPYVLCWVIHQNVFQIKHPKSNINNIAMQNITVKWTRGRPRDLAILPRVRTLDAPCWLVEGEEPCPFTVWALLVAKSVLAMSSSLSLVSSFICVRPIDDRIPSFPACSDVRMPDNQRENQWYSTNFA